MARIDGRNENQLREIKITRKWLDHAEGSVLVEFGKTRVLCVASFTPGVPRWLKDSGRVGSHLNMRCCLAPHILAQIAKALKES